MACKCNNKLFEHCLLMLRYSLIYYVILDNKDVLARHLRYYLKLRLDIKRVKELILKEK